MIMAKEQAFLKAQEQFDNLKNLVELAARDEHRIDTVERDLMGQLLALGRTLLIAFVAHQGDGDVGPTIEVEDGEPLRRLPMRHDRRYLSIFGELTIPRIVYGSREGQKIQRVPLDERLGLPESSFSYVLEDWSQRLCLKESFAEARNSLEMLLGLRLGSRTLEQLNQTVAAYASPFRATIETPPAEEEDPLLVVTADGKGVPMRRPAEPGPKPHHRRTKGEGEQEANGLRRSGVQHQAVREESRGHPRRSATSPEGRAAPQPATQARLGRDEPRD